MKQTLTIQNLIDIMCDALVDPEKKKLLPYHWQDKEFNISGISNTRALINYFAYWIDVEMKHREAKEKQNETIE